MNSFQICKVHGLHVELLNQLHFINQYFHSYLLEQFFHQKEALGIAFVVSLLYDRSSRAKVVAMSGLVINGPAFNGEFSTLIYIFRDSLPALKSSKKVLCLLRKFGGGVQQQAVSNAIGFYYMHPPQHDLSCWDQSMGV